MKEAISVLLFALISISANAQAPSVQWQRSLGGTGADAVLSFYQTTDSGYIAASKSASNDGDVTGNHGYYDCWLVKLTSWGDIIWQKSYGGSADEIPCAVQQTTDGGYIVCSFSKSADGDATLNHGDFDFWILKVDDTGKIQWQKSYGGTNADVPHDIQQTTDGGYIVAGWTKSADGDVTSNHGGQDYWVLKLDATGNIVWQKTYGGSADDYATSVKQTADGGYIVLGTTSSNDGDVSGNHGGADVWVVKLTSIGSITWQKCYGGSGDDAVGDEAYPASLRLTYGGGYVVAAFSTSSDGDLTVNKGGNDLWVLNLTSTGGIIWQKSLGGSGDDEALSAWQTKDSGFIVTGPTNSLDGDVVGVRGLWDDWVVKLSKTGNLVWAKTYGGTGDDNPYHIQQTSDSEYVIAGYSTSNDGDVSGNHGGYDGWVAKLAYCSLPAAGAITGPSVVCAGSGIHLSDPAVGGAWSASNGNATVSGGLVTGVYAGAVAILYTKTNSCGTGGATHIVHVNPTPVPVIAAVGTMLNTTLTYSRYQWIKNGTAVSGATNATYNATVTGIYSVTVTDSNGCTGTSAGITVFGVGITTVNNNLQCSIMPNPTTGMIYIKGAGNLGIKVYNMMGQLMKEASNTDHISIAELSGGMYITRLFDEQGRYMWQGKIMKE